jgi:hypothetical protein
LFVWHSGQISGPQSPSHVYPASHHSGVAAGRVNQDAIEWRDRNDLFWKAAVRPIVMETADNPGAEARHVVSQDLKPLWIAITCHNCSPVFHELGDVAGFAPWRGACIEDFFCGFGIKKLAGDHCARILNIAMAIVESVLRQSMQFYELSIAYQRPRLWILLEEFSAIDF